MQFRSTPNASGQTPFAEIAQSGYTRVRLMVPWETLEPKEGVYATEGIGEWIRWAKRREIEVAICISGGHSAYADLLEVVPIRKKAVKALAKAIKALKHEIGGQGVIWEIWDAPKDFDSFLRLHERIVPILQDAKQPELIAGPSLNRFDLSFVDRCIRSGITRDWHTVIVQAPPKSSPQARVAEIASLRSLIGFEQPVWLLDRESDLVTSSLINYAAGVPGTVVAASSDRQEFAKLVEGVQGHPFLGYFDHSATEAQALLFGTSKEYRMVAWTTDPAGSDVEWPSAETIVRSAPSRHLSSDPKVFVGTPPITSGLSPMAPVNPITPLATQRQAREWAKSVGMCEESGDSLWKRIESLEAVPFWYAVRPNRSTSPTRRTLIVPPPRLDLGIFVTRTGWGVAMNRSHGTSLAIDLELERSRRISSTCHRLNESDRFGAVLAESSRPHQHDLLQIRSVLGTSASPMDEGRTGRPVRIRVAYPQELDRLTAEYESGTTVPKARWAAPQEGFRCEKLVYEVDFEVSPSRALRILPTESDRAMLLSDVLGFGLLVCGDGRRATLRMQLVDASNQTFELTYGQIDWIGWRYVRFSLSTDRFWGGSGNGQIHWPIRYQTVATLDSEAGSVEGTIQIACPTVLVAP